MLKHFYFFILMSTSLTTFGQVDTANVAIASFSAISSEARVNKTYIDDRNVIWLATNQGLIETVSDGSRSKSYLVGIEIIDVIPDSKNMMWAASTQSIVDVSSGANYPLPQPVNVTDITYQRGNLWVGTENGLYEFNTSTRKYKTYDERNTPMISSKINFVHADKNGILWVGTDKGYLRLEGEKWKLEDKKIKMLATCENKEGQWIISEKDMFLINKFNRLFPVKLDATQYKGKINHFAIDSKDRIYIASDILVRYDPYKEAIVNYTADAASIGKASLSLACDKNDNIWIGTDGAGFYKLQFGALPDEVLNASIIIENSISCPGAKSGILKVTASGGAKPYSYNWSVQNNSNKSTISSLSAGTYTVTVTDKFQNSAIATLEFNDPQPLTIELESSQRVSTPDAPNGALDIIVGGGSAPYSFLWSNGAKTQNVNKLNSGLYSLTVRDKNDCQATATFNVKREKFIPDLEMSKIVLGQKLRINDLNFDADSSGITSANYDILDEVYEFLNANETVSVEIGGHTNTIPPHEYCDQLSSSRAKNVTEYLFKRGIDRKRITSKGYGKREPLTDSTSAAGRQKNQRVEIKILTL
jgi:outer membrane protein OmpA-like peptidoglycan-associated protein/ligand-binding sensor domain-containing protein